MKSMVIVTTTFGTHARSIIMSRFVSSGGDGPDRSPGIDEDRRYPAPFTNVKLPRSSPRPGQLRMRDVSRKSDSASSGRRVQDPDRRTDGGQVDLHGAALHGG